MPLKKDITTLLRLTDEPITITTAKVNETNSPRTIRIVSIADAAAYHQVSEKAIYAAIKANKMQYVKGIPEHQLDRYKPDRVNQARGSRRGQVK